MYVIIGGGIAGVSCVEVLAQESPHEDICLVSNSVLLKTATNVEKLGVNIERFDVEEQSAQFLEKKYTNVRVVMDTVRRLDPERHLVFLEKHDPILYKKLCICSGSEPKLIARNNDFVIGIRDTESIHRFSSRLSNAKRVLVVGNGGIALELVHNVQNCDIIWAIKNKTIGTAFFDADSALFFMSSAKESSEEKSTTRRLHYQVKQGEKRDTFGSALGPNWRENLDMSGSAERKNLTIEYETEVAEICTNETFYRTFTDHPREHWLVFVKLTNGKVYGCDLIISATGVVPNCTFVKGVLETAPDGGIKVDRVMRTSQQDVFAAGDVCTTNWESKSWFQMRLWTQARQMGVFAAYCMSSECAEDAELYFPFEAFVHVTQFFGHKVVLLGSYGGQNLESGYEVMARVVEGKEYVRLILKDNKLKGALIIGNTDLEETFENLILNQIDLSNIKEGLLDKSVDIEDYFD